MGAKPARVDAPVGAVAIPRPLPRLATALLALALLSAALLVDPWAIEPFDSPKWLLVELCVAGALAATLLSAGVPRWREWPRGAAMIAALGTAVVLALVAATLLADVPTAALPTLRCAVLLAAVPLLGAMHGFGDALRRHLLPATLLGFAINGVLSLLQWAGVSPITLANSGGRYPTGALLGNEGFLALSAALLLPALAVLLGSGLRLPARRQLGARRRLVVLALLALIGLLVIVLNRQLTATVAIGAGLAVVVLLALRQWRALRHGLWAGLLGSLLVLLPMPRSLLAVALPDAPWLQAHTTQRLGAWAAADGMWRAQPWLGHGLGSFAREGQGYRLAAEQALGMRLLPPVTATGFAEAHNDYLQLAAEAGLPALLAALLALGLLLDRLFQRATLNHEARALAGTLVAGAVAALAWFPLQVPLLALILLLALGRAWRLIVEAPG